MTPRDVALMTSRDVRGGQTTTHRDRPIGGEIRETRHAALLTALNPNGNILRAPLVAMG